MLDKVKDFIKKQNMLQLGDKILAAVSGGPDSIALLDILTKLQGDYQCSLHVAHLNHMFRGEESLADAFFVQEYASSLGICVTYASADIPALLEDGGLPKKWPELFVIDISEEWPNFLTVIR